MEKTEIEIVMKFIAQSKEGIDLRDIIDITPIIRKYKYFSKFIKILVKEYEKTNKVYTYMLTFTINPEWHDVKDILIHREIETYIYGFAIARNPTRSDIVMEGTDEDHKHTHFHLGIEVKKTIDFSNHLKFYRKTYGIVDISKSYSNQYKNVLTYINKSIPSTELVNTKT